MVLAFAGVSAASMAQNADPTEKFSVSTNSFWSNWFVRVHLEPLARYGIPLSRLAELFVRSSEVRTGSTDGMLKKLSLLKEICRQGKTPFDEETLSAFLKKYVAAGCPAIHHSETYRRLYHPAYRVICREFLPELIGGECAGSEPEIHI